MDEVFDSHFLRRLEQLTLKVTKHFRSLGRGDRRSRRRGQSPEFSEHKHYHAGDDIRRIDWLAYARLGELFLKETSAEQDLNVHVLLDCSASMAVGRKFNHARQVTAALLYLALSSGDRVRLRLFAGGRLGRELGPLRGRRSYPAILEFLRALEGAGKTGLGEMARRFCARGAKPGLVVVISDLLDKGGYEEALKRLRYTRYEPMVIHTLTEDELDPQLTGDHDLKCVESGENLSLTLDRSAIRLYRQKVESYLADIQTFCRKHSIGYVLSRDDESLEKLFFHDLRLAGFFQ